MIYIIHDVCFDACLSKIAIETMQLFTTSGDQLYLYN